MQKTKKIKKKILKDFVKEKQGFKIQSIDEDLENRENLTITNKTKIIIAIIIMLILIVININFISATNFSIFISNFYTNNQKFYFLTSLIILGYILYDHLNYFNIKINNEELNISNYKLIARLFGSINHYNISKKNLLDYSITNHYLSFNKTLTLKIKNDEREVFVKSFVFSFLSKKHELKIKKYLLKLLKKN